MSLIVKSGLSVKSYIENDINLWLDGIWNAGKYTHDSNLKSWVDISGKCGSINLNTGNIVGENCISSNGTKNGTMILAYTPPLNLTTFTFEVVFRQDKVIHGNQVIIGRNYTKSYYLNMSTSGFGYWLGNKNGAILREPPEVGKIYQVQITCTGTSANAYLNGVKKISNGPANVVSDTSNLELFSRFSGGMDHFQGSIFAVRLYNRILTNDELVYNYKCDKERFKI